MKERNCSQCKYFDEKIVAGKYGNYVEPICKVGYKITTESMVDADNCPEFESEDENNGRNT